MESFFSFSTLLNLVLTVIWFVSGIRDFQGKDPLINLPFNQYNRLPYHLRCRHRRRSSLSRRLRKLEP